MPALTPAPHVGPADWIVEDLQTFGESVLSLLPTDFPAYVRVFHPAGRIDRYGDPVNAPPGFY